MAYETSALRGDQQRDVVAEDDYQSFSAALSASARGRAFLAEYARRNRHADTAVVLAALDRLEAVARSQKAAPEAERIRQDLRALLETLQSAKPQIDLSPGAIKAATLSALLEFVQARIEALVGPAAAAAPTPGVRHFLAPVPPSDEPELPIPRPGASAQPSIALVQTIIAPVEAEPAAGPTLDPMVLSLDPRVGPVFGEPAAEAPRPANVIADINFVDALIVRDTTESAAEDAAPALSGVTEVAVAPPPSAAVLPPLELTAGEPALAVMAEPADKTDEATAAHADALVRATNATADAIDNIVAAAAALMAETAIAEEAAMATAVDETASAEIVVVETIVAETTAVATAVAEPAIAETAVTETAVTETAVTETITAEIAFGDAAALAETAPVEAKLPELGFVATQTAEAELTQAAPKPSAPIAAPQVRDDALAAIMAMSEEERLALFT